MTVQLASAGTLAWCKEKIRLRLEGVARARKGDESGHVMLSAAYS